ncbi:MAG: hypothetical protein E6Q97_14270 [Desulfurellales bacterium]|nr:MAG: hypothetical protein E6Q97_14270 [Desulfurellales bacterium]
MGLAPNCQGYKVDANGKVIGVQLGILPVANSRYEVYSATLRNEYDAGGRREAYCQVLDRNGIRVGAVVRLAYPWTGGPTFAHNLAPGNPDNTHPVINGYTPPAIGPLALYVGAPNAPESDIVYGLGLPLNRHVSFDVVFRERGAVEPPPIDPPTDPALRELALRVERIEQSLDAFVKAWQTGR